PWPVRLDTPVRPEKSRPRLRAPGSCLHGASEDQGPTMKLALVTRRYPPLIGGAEKVLSYLAGALAAEGAEVTVLTSRIPGPGRSEQDDVPTRAVETARGTGQDPQGRMRVARLATSRLRFWGTWRYMQNLERWFRKNPVDLAYVSMLKHDAYV